MAEPFPSLFAPLKVGTYTLKNRIMNTGHAAHFQTGDGIPTDRYVDYVRERAKGGVGIIVTGFTVTRYDGDAALSLANYDERITAAYGKFSEATHAYGVPMLAQLGHRGRRVSDGAAYLQRTIEAPSAVPAPDFSSPQLVPHAMSTAEVEEVVESFATATRRVVRGEMDGVELAVGLDFLFANFLSEYANRRDDKYGGGTLEERMTFLDEVIDVVRGELGPERLLGIRFYDDLVDYSLGLEDYKRVASLVEAGGKVNYFNMWQGIVPSPRSGREHWPPHYYKPGQFAYLPAGLKEATTLPVVGHGAHRLPGVGGQHDRGGQGRRHRHGAGADCRRTLGQQGPRRPRRRYPHLHRLHPELRRTHLPRHGRRLHLQPGDRTRARVVRAAAGRNEEEGGDRRRRAGRLRGRTHRGGARPRRPWSSRRASGSAVRSIS